MSRQSRAIGLTGLLSVALVPMIASSAFAQSSNSAAMTGIIEDPTDARIPNATVKLINTDTGTENTATTSKDGNFTIPNVLPGHYRLEIDGAGFETTQLTGITLSVGDNKAVIIHMKIGTSQQTVRVDASGLAVNRTDGSVSTVVDSKIVENAPLNGRDVTQLLAIQAGVLQTSSNGTQGNGFSVNGSRQTGVNFFLDGGENVNSYQNFSGLFPNPDAVQEFSVQTNNFSSEYGNATGAVVSVETKSGTNQFHGSAFEYVRNGIFNARNYFAAKTDSLKRNQFGGTIGGPILRNRLFFFFSYQDTTIRSNPQLTHEVLPTTAMRTGDFSAISQPIINPATKQPFPGNQIPPSSLSPVAEAFLQYLPDPGTPDGSRYTGFAIVNNQSEYTGRIDWQLRKHRLTGRLFSTTLTQPFTGNLNDYGTMTSSGDAKSYQPYIQGTFGDVWALSGTFLNDLTIAEVYNRTLNDWRSVTIPLNYSQAGVQGIAVKNPASVYLVVSGGFTARPGWQYDQNERDVQVSDKATWVRGANELKIGAEFIRTTNAIKNDFRTMGQFTFNGSISSNAMADFMLGAAYQFSQGGGEFKQLSELRSGYFVQDNYRVSPSLAVSMGLRWDPMVPARDDLGRVECFRPGFQSQRFPNAPSGYLLAGDPGCPSGGFNNFINSIAPRVGFAKGLGEKTVLRGGFGLFWNPLSAIQYNNFVDSAPFSPQVTLSGVSFQDPYAGRFNPFPRSFAPFIPSKDVSFVTPLGSFGVFGSSFQPSYMESYNLTVERTVRRNAVLRASYIGSGGRHLSVLEDLNYARYSPGATIANTQQRRPYQNFASILNAESAGSSSYNGLQVAVDRRIEGGLSLEVNYTYSKSIDIQSTEAEPGQGTSIIPNRDDLNRGPSDFDIKHRLVATYIWDLPTLRDRAAWMRQTIGSWELSGIWTFQSGSPFTVISGVDQSRSGLGVDRADLVGDPRLDTHRSSAELVSKYFNTAAFQTNALGTFGNSPRNFLYGPGEINADMALMKLFSLPEKARFELRAEAFNTFNHTNLGNPNSTLTSSAFGKITSAGAPRILQFAGKIIF
jgi:Carboxypeptidase regulatory-like domain/TonB-dependent Receptor Plug Domain